LWPLVQSKKLDVGVAMYHDQGQIAVKLRGFEVDQRGQLSPGGVNITLGLPLIRTSLAHGSAYDIAGKGVASEKSLLEAILLAVKMCQIKHSSSNR
jgi:4-hydroxythreonine-4-phosphate dehydrogenase